MVCYLARVIVFPSQSWKVHCIHAIFPKSLSDLPAPFLAVYGNFHTLKRYFRTEKAAQYWLDLVIQEYYRPPVEKTGQLELF